MTFSQVYKSICVILVGFVFSGRVLAMEYTETKKEDSIEHKKPTPDIADISDFDADLATLLQEDQPQAFDEAALTAAIDELEEQDNQLPLNTALTNSNITGSLLTDLNLNAMQESWEKVSYLADKFVKDGQKRGMFGDQREHNDPQALTKASQEEEQQSSSSDSSSDESNDIDSFGSDEDYVPVKRSQQPKIAIVSPKQEIKENNNKQAELETYQKFLEESAAAIKHHDAPQKNDYLKAAQKGASLKQADVKKTIVPVRKKKAKAPQDTVSSDGAITVIRRGPTKADEPVIKNNFDEFRRIAEEQEKTQQKDVQHVKVSTADGEMHDLYTSYESSTHSLLDEFRRTIEAQAKSAQQVSDDEYTFAEERPTVTLTVTSKDIKNAQQLSEKDIEELLMLLINKSVQREKKQEAAKSIVLAILLYKDQVETVRTIISNWAPEDQQLISNTLEEIVRTIDIAERDQAVIAQINKHNEPITVSHASRQPDVNNNNEDGFFPVGNANDQFQKAMNDLNPVKDNGAGVGLGNHNEQEQVPQQLEEQPVQQPHNNAAVYAAGQGSWWNTMIAALTSLSIVSGGVAYVAYTIPTCPFTDKLASCIKWEFLEQFKNKNYESAYKILREKRDIMKAIWTQPEKVAFEKMVRAAIDDLVKQQIAQQDSYLPWNKVKSDDMWYITTIWQMIKSDFKSYLPTDIAGLLASIKKGDLQGLDVRQQDWSARDKAELCNALSELKKKSDHRDEVDDIYNNRLVCP